MKNALTIGIVGGMSPESTVIYYQRIVRKHQEIFGDHSYPRIVIASVSFQRYIDWQHQKEWRRIAEELLKEFQTVARAGADFAVLATNTMHKILPQIVSPIPVLSVIDAVADYAKANGINTVGLTGTRFTMSDGFYKEGLENRGLSVLVPDTSEQERIHHIIYDELICGTINPVSVRDFDRIAENLTSRGADTVLLGCTELVLLTQENVSVLKFIDSTRIHAEVAWEESISKSHTCDKLIIPGGESNFNFA